MARAERRITKGAHIKRNTHGTSNEISFSVLDAARNTADAENPMDKDDPFWAHADEEVVRRKRRRRARRARSVALMAAAGIAVVALAGAGAWWALQASQQTQGELDRAVALVEEADEVILPFDELAVEGMTADLSAMADDGFRTRYEQMTPQLDEALAKLDEAQADAEGAQGSLRAPRDLEASNQILVSISARRNMIGAGRDALGVTDDAVAAYAAVGEGWAQLLAADTAARDAASLASLEGADNIQASLGKTDEAISGFATARDDFAQAAGLCPDAGLSPYVDYINTRIEALEAARASNNAYLADDVDAMVQSNNRYNTLDSQAAALMRTLSQQPTDLVVIDYGRQRETIFQTYMQDRQRAADSDAFLNDYVSNRG